MRDYSEHIIKRLRGETITCQCSAWNSSECACDSDWPEYATEDAARLIIRLEHELEKLNERTD